MQAKYYIKHDDNSIQCTLCNNKCFIKNGFSGSCHVRFNSHGNMVLPFYGAISSIGIDAIEKKPLYHFLPHTLTFSVGYLGCNLHCPFCQNYSISQSNNVPNSVYTAELLIHAAKKSGCPSIAHTYSEPLVHAEFVAEAMAKSRKAGLYNILVTNGSVSEEVARDVLPYCDAANIDIKAWDNDFYKKELSGSLDLVKRFVELAYSYNVHIELTTLVIPTKNDSPSCINDIATWIASISENIPYHLSAYRPMYKYAIEATPPKTVLQLVDIAKKKLKYVYAGNI